METTQATVRESLRTEAIHRALAVKARRQTTPSAEGVDSAHVDAQALISSREQFGISLAGPGRVDISWQTRRLCSISRLCS